jgi:hypothetical protein
MITDWKALCADLLRELDHASTWDYQQALKDHARAALAEPAPEGPTVMEIIELANEIEAAELGQVDLVRAALARWGNL